MSGEKHDKRDKENDASSYGEVSSSIEKSVQGATQKELKRTVGIKERRKLHAKLEGRQSPWFGLGMFGLVGWSVALPTLLGIATGRWIDRRWPSQISWTLTLLICGVAIGGINAWYWMHKESS